MSNGNEVMNILIRSMEVFSNIEQALLWDEIVLGKHFHWQKIELN